MSFKTPGVYIKEISLFPPSVAEVETAIPAFIGYTEKAERNGESLKNIPTKVSSLLEYREIFGGAYSISTVNVTVNKDNNYAVEAISIPICFYLFDSLRLFFDNGGGECYIVSVGFYGDISSSAPIAVGDETDPTNFPGLRVGIKALEQYDEPTILLFPDAVKLPDDTAAKEAQFYSLQQMALSQCNKLQDRVAVLDAKENISGGWNTAVNNFRDGIGINNLKYGAAYTPFLYNSFPQDVRFSMISSSISDNSSGTPVLLTNANLLNLTSDPNLNALIKSALDASSDQTKYDSAGNTLKGTLSSIDAQYKKRRNDLLSLNPASLTLVDDVETNLGLLLQLLIDMLSEAVDWKTGAPTVAFSGANLKRDLEAYAKDSLNTAAKKLISLEKNTSFKALFTPLRDTDVIYGTTGLNLNGTAVGWLDTAVASIVASTINYAAGTTNNLQIAANAVNDINGIFNELLGFYDSIASAIQTNLDLAESILYQSHPIIGNIVKQVQKEMSKMPPSGAIAGIYSFVDESRGVWKAPANVSLSSVLGPSVIIDDNIQEGLNVDPTAGKSINAIRAFTGKGTLVWGARTLAGNDNEWRYISVRRFFNVVEESVKKATAFAVFEPNDARTWSKVRALISNYLVQKWKDGALQGATPEEAFYVKVGLGLTMTADDILNGFMKVEIGMAVVRPAEFIILSFSHKLVGTP